jgi:hypothetical protein
MMLSGTDISEDTSTEISEDTNTEEWL